MWDHSVGPTCVLTGCISVRVSSNIDRISHGQLDAAVAFAQNSLDHIRYYAILCYIILSCYTMLYYTVMLYGAILY